jgi:hypothetical protein
MPSIKKNKLQMAIIVPKVVVQMNDVAADEQHPGAISG